MGREARCTYGGKVYLIPEIWIAGMMDGARRRGEPCTYTDVIAFWAWNVEQEALHASH